MPHERRAPSKHRPDQAENFYTREAREREREARRERKRQERIEAAATYCIPVLTNGWSEAVADRATDYVTEETWQRLFRTSSTRRRCTTLAQAAATVLQAKKMLHQLFGKLAEWVVSLATDDRIVQIFTRELVSTIPRPHEAQVVAAARGIQITGILLCVFNGEDLTRCQCFVDLALVETKTMVKKILVAGMYDWTGLAAFVPKDGTLLPSSKP